jgi:hypothetical protein
MARGLRPIPDRWYAHLDKGQAFRVIDFDRRGGWIELQHFDGDVEEIDFESWYDMDLELAPPPEDWTGPMDDVEDDDLGYTETAMGEADWREPLEELHADGEPWEDATPFDERDEWGELETRELLPYDADRA